VACGVAGGRPGAGAIFVREASGLRTKPTFNSLYPYVSGIVPGLIRPRAAPAAAVGTDPSHAGQEHKNMQIRVLHIALLAAALSTGLVATRLTLGVDNPAPAAAAKPDKSVAKPIKLDGDMGKLDLTDAQKADIVKLRTDNKAAIAQLQDQIRKLSDEEKAKEVALLTPEQQAKLTALQEASRKAAEEKRAAAAAAAATQKSVTTPKAPKDAAKPDSKLP
jgi:Spy/CpxP family protein refolding chaperone